jgi:ATP-binding cassette subfamily B protein
MIKTRLISLLGHAKKYIGYNILFQWIALIAQIVASFQAADLIARVLEGRTTTVILARTAAILIVCIAVRSACEWFSQKMTFMASCDVKRILRDKIYQKLLRLGVSYRERIATSEIVQLQTEGVEQLETYFGQYLSQLAYSLLAPATLFLVTAVLVSVRAAMILLAFVPLIPLSIVIVQKIAKKILGQYWTSYTDLGDVFLECIQGLTTLKIYRADDLKAHQMDEEAEEFRRATMRVLIMQLNSTSVMDIMAYGGATAGMVSALTLYLRGRLDFGDALVVIFLAAEFFLPLRKLGSYFHIAMNGMAASDRIFALLDLPETRRGREQLTKTVDVAKERDRRMNFAEQKFCRSNNISVQLQDVGFYYDASRQILKGVNMALPAGSLVALVGPSGCGKSTIAGIISGRNRRYTGSVKIGSMEGGIHELRDVREKSLLAHVVLVRHNNYIFKGTVADNLRMGRPEATDEELYEALDAVHLVPFVKNRGGLSMQLDEKGANISGGQAQRIGLARALLVDAEVMIFDEATSNIDAESEELIMGIIREIAKTKTVLMISHRLHNCVKADCIYMCEDGAITESVTHSELIARGGSYSALYKAQMSLETYAEGVRGDKKKHVESCEVRGSATSITDEDRAYENIRKSLIAYADETATGKEKSGKKVEKNSAKSLEKEKRRNAVVIMGQLIGLVRPLMPVMCTAVVLGVLGYLSAIFSSVFAGNVLLHGLIFGTTEAVYEAEMAVDAFAFLDPGHSEAARAAAQAAREAVSALRAQGTPLTFTSLATRSAQTLFVLMGVFAVLRGILHYAEQYCNHYIAFRLLAIIRHEVYAALRRLAPAKLEGRDKGNLISIITSDIELLEVFYAHTISPIAIAFITSVFMIAMFMRHSLYAGLLAAAAYIAVGVIIPLINGKLNGDAGLLFRNAFGDMTSFVLDSLRGLDEIIQFGCGRRRREEISSRSDNLSDLQRGLSKMTGVQRVVTTAVILIFSYAMLFLLTGLYSRGGIGYDGLLITQIAFMSSFGPVVALGSLSNSLSHTLAAGDRVLDLLEEMPLVWDVSGTDGREGWDGFEHFRGAELSKVTFSYGDEMILKDFSILFWPGRIIGIHGPSGSGKSTILKLLMRFFDVEEGRVMVSGEDVRHIATTQLRDTESLVEQETHLFHDSIANNILIGKPGASRVEIVRAAKKAAIHDFIKSLPKGYDTTVGELGDTLSGGERQRIGIARAFLHNAPFMLLDEPTSNLDSLNEGIILKSLMEECRDRTVVIVSHRESTMNAADTIFEM